MLRRMRIRVLIVLTECSFLCCSKHGLSWWLRGKEFASNAGGTGLIPRLARFPWRRKWQFQYSFLGGPMDRGAWWATVHRVARAGQ